MQVALDGADACLALGLDTALSQLVFQQGSTHVHSAGSHQHFGYEDLVVLELLTNNSHTGQQTFLQNGLGRNALVQSLLHQILDDLCLTGLQLQRNFIHIHNLFPPIVILICQ